MIQRNKKLMRWLSGVSICALSALFLTSSGTALAGLPSKSGALNQTFHLLQAPEALAADQAALRIRLDYSALESLTEEATGFGKKVIVPFPISETESLELVLERFSLIGPQTRIVIADQTGQREIQIPEIVMLRGIVAGQPNSLAYLALRSGANGGGNGFVTLESGETRYLSSGVVGNDFLAPGELIISQITDPRFGALPEGVEFCGLDALGQTPLPPSAPLAAAATLDNRGVRLAQIAVEGDQEFVGLFGGDEIAAAAEGIAAHVIAEPGMGQGRVHVFGDAQGAVIGDPAPQVIGQGGHGNLVFRPGPEHQDQPHSQKRHRQPLSHGGAETQEPQMRVGLAENLGHGARRPVAGQKDASQKARAPAQSFLARQPQQDGEQDRPFAQGFVDLARVAGIGAAAGKDHRPGHVGDAPEQLAVDEIGQAAEKQPQRRHAGDPVGERP